MALNFMQDIKQAIDPKNIFAINNTIYRLEGEEEKELSGHHWKLLYFINYFI